MANGYGDRLPESDSLAAQAESTEAFGTALRSPLQASFGGGVRSARGHIGGEVRQKPVCHRRHRRHPEKDGGALSDVEKPAPSLYEAKYRVGLAPLTERDSEKEADQKAHPSPFRG